MDVAEQREASYLLRICYVPAPHLLYTCYYGTFYYSNSSLLHSATFHSASGYTFAAHSSPRSVCGRWPRGLTLGHRFNLSYSCSGNNIYWSILPLSDATAPLSQSDIDPGFTYRRPISVVLSIAIHGVFVSKSAKGPKPVPDPVTRVCTDCASSQESRIMGSPSSVHDARPFQHGRGGVTLDWKKIRKSLDLRA
ncbi:hypothetical protein K432DRAFT_380586 [Lepidopterella palustris CBS 459.81]|uniref:Uncharacterized protein n=1 Tax=Lepidopterella palustris CBS 459.81 TaxID=1314670 RepID=A0A8E2EEQ9_9PEZI|nr:hypothetical protein K432DRAFT_380586 [Lepidopterella palustris CBS 459.81]